VRRTSVPLQVLRTGTDNVPFHVPTLNSPLSSVASTGSATSMAAPTMGSQSQPDYAGMATPSVWRTRDRTQAAAKVDALASGGMDDFEIPAFLRKQAD
jgi:cell division protein FtsZ